MAECIYYQMEDNDGYRLSPKLINAVGTPIFHLMLKLVSKVIIRGTDTLLLFQTSARLDFLSGAG